jgi:hypothetical protein
MMREQKYIQELRRDGWEKKIRSYAALEFLPLIQLVCKRIRLGNLQPDHNILVHQPGNRMVKKSKTKCKA